MLQKSGSLLVLAVLVALSGNAAALSRRDQASLDALNERMQAAEARYRDAMVRISNADPEGQKQSDAALEDMEDVITECMKQRGCSVPTMLAAYIIVFGDVLSAKSLLDEAETVRTDEVVDYNADRAHLIFGARNAFMSIFGPDVAMCGPKWAAMLVVVIERFKGGPKAMKSIIGGVGSFRWGTNSGLLLLPVVTLVQPILGVALSLTLLIQGYVSVRLGILEARSQRDLGIAGVIGAVLAIKGASWAFGIGVVLCLLIYGKNFFKGEVDGTFAKDLKSVDGKPGKDVEPVMVNKRVVGEAMAD